MCTSCAMVHCETERWCVAACSMVHGVHMHITTWRVRWRGMVTSRPLFVRNSFSIVPFLSITFYFHSFLFFQLYTYSYDYNSPSSFINFLIFTPCMVFHNMKQGFPAWMIIIMAKSNSARKIRTRLLEGSYGDSLLYLRKVWTFCLFALDVV